MRFFCKMFVTQQIVPRCKEWLPLATNQLRLRNLIQILAFSLTQGEERPTNERGLKLKDDKKPKSRSYYYTLHFTTMSAPFYTSEKVSSDSPKWKEIELNSFVGNVSSSTDALVIRLWSTHNDKIVKEESEDQVIAIWGVYLNGLTYLGQSLGTDLSLKPNSIVFLMPGGYFTDINCLEPRPKIRYISISVNQCDIQPSYTVNTLTRLHTIQQVIKKELSEVDLLKQKISMGDFFRNENRGRTMLRRLLNKNKPKITHQHYLKIKENIEIAKYRVQILREEKSLLASKLKDLKAHIDILSDQNNLMESRIMENYRLLRRNVQIQRELKTEHISRRESQLHSKAKLNFRAKQLISELNLIYPIVEESPEKFTICGVHLPNSEDFAGHNDFQISVALGFVTHVIQMISIFLQVPLRYPVVHYGSQSRIIDHITEKIPDNEREFPLYCRGKDKFQFQYAVYLLNKNIAQLRWLYGLPTLDLRNTLSNLSSLLRIKSENSNVDHSNRSASSSTADVCSSCPSMSSPVGSILSLSNKKPIKHQRISGSCVNVATESLTASPSKPFTGHRISKSVGSTKDMLINVFSINNTNKHNMNTRVGNAFEGGSSFSYSLDKGLNVYENCTKSQPVNHIGSYSFSNTSRSKDFRMGLDETVKRDRYPWEAVGNQEIAINSCMCADVFRGSRDGLVRNSGDIKMKVVKYDDKVPDLENVTADRPSASSDLELAEVANEIMVEDTIEKTVEEHFSYDSEMVTNKESKSCDEGSCLIVSDSLFDSVTSRTEALASQSTSFIMFRSRYNSTVENSS